MIRSITTAGIFMVAVLACAAKDEQPKGNAGFVHCGRQIADVLHRVDGLTVNGSFPAQLDSRGDRMLTGTVTVASTGFRLAGVGSPEADVYVVKAGEVVATPLPKDSIGRAVSLTPGASAEFAARGTIRPCTQGESLPSGRYEVYAVVSVVQDNGPVVVVTGGPWPLEVT